MQTYLFLISSVNYSANAASELTEESIITEEEDVSSITEEELSIIASEEEDTSINTSSEDTEDVVSPSSTEPVELQPARSRAAETERRETFFNIGKEENKLRTFLMAELRSCSPSLKVD